MLDENLPTFYLSAAKDKIKHHATFYLTRGGDEPEPAYSLNYPDPSTPVAKNCYAVGLFDPYSPEVLYGEVLVRPEWTQPTLNMEEIRRNGGVPPPPEPLLPSEFTIQLYNPDQQIKVSSRFSSILNTERFDFDVPQHTFRLPSTSLLDRSENDPTADANTPKINFTFKRESKLSKEFVCYLRGRSTDIYNRKKSKEPDITVALFRSLREVTIYESNLQRVETEDPKGLEVILLLAAVTIKDIWFGNMREVFNVTDVSDRRRSSIINQIRPGGAGGDRPPGAGGRPAATGGAALGALYAQGPAQPPRHNQTPSQQHGMGGQVAYTVQQQQQQQQQQQPYQRRTTDPPAPDARTQWEIDAETAMLKAQVEAERREFQRQEEARRRERERLDEEETKRLRKMVEAEEKERIRRQKEAEKETKRLQKLYGTSHGQSLAPPHVQSAPLPQEPFPRPHSVSGPPQFPQYPTPHAHASGALPPPQPPRPTNNASNPHLQPGPYQNQGSSNSGRNGYLDSVIDLASNLTSGNVRNKLGRKKSSVW